MIVEQFSERERGPKTMAKHYGREIAVEGVGSLMHSLSDNRENNLFSLQKKHVCECPCDRYFPPPTLQARQTIKRQYSHEVLRWLMPVAHLIL